MIGSSLTLVIAYPTPSAVAGCQLPITAQIAQGIIGF
jgi:hypothetical protein